MPEAESIHVPTKLRPVRINPPVAPKVVKPNVVQLGPGLSGIPARRGFPAMFHMNAYALASFPAYGKYQDTVVEVMFYVPPKEAGKKVKLNDQTWRIKFEDGEFGIAYRDELTCMHDASDDDKCILTVTV